MFRVLIADDQRINRVLLARCLDPEVYQIVEAENGREALERFEEETPDVVLLDIMMPEMDGFEAARAMKARVGQDHVPIIMVTSLSDEKSLSEGMDAGADDFIPKPFNRMVLASKLKAAIRTRQVFQTLRAKKQELQDLHEQSHNEQVMAEKLMAGVLRTSTLGHPMFKYRSQPMDVFNGDLLMAGEGPGGRIRVMLGDFSGHGLAAAIGGLPVAVDFNQRCRSESSLFELAQSANGKLREVLPRDRFLAAAFLDIDPYERVIEVMNAGMPPIVIRGAEGGIVRKVPSTHLPLAILDDIDRPEDIIRVRLSPGEKMYIFSDGVTEAMNLEGEAFGDDRFEALIAANRQKGTCFDTVLAELDGFVGDAPADDDVTLLEIDLDAAFAEQLPSMDQAKRSFSPARLGLHVTPEMFRTGDVLQLVQSVLESVGPLQGRRAEVFAVVAELINNAMDHGVLGLDSSMKADLSGFAEFYEERARRLEAATEGFVDVQFVLVRTDDTYRMRIEVEDSGDGFDLSKLEDSSSSVAHGRGIEMVRGICESVMYHPPGNRVVAVYAWTNEEDARSSDEEAA